MSEFEILVLCASGAGAYAIYALKQEIDDINDNLDTVMAMFERRLQKVENDRDS